MKKLRSISIIIPTLNCEKALKECLHSIKNQNYPRKKIEIIIIDGGSKDDTLKISRKYTNKIFSNPLKTAEAGKAIGVKKAKNDLLAFIDSDNILPDKNWFRKMIKPFEDSEIVGSEPLYYTYREQDSITTRYFALLGMNDPLCLFIGNYDRYSYITGKWTEMKVKEEDKGDYLKVELNEKQLPTIGANGFMIKRKFLKNFNEDFIFDIDIVFDLIKNGKNKFAKVRIGVVHIFSSSLSIFVKKQERRIRDYGYYKDLKLRKYPWTSVDDLKLLKFIVYTVLIFPLILQAMKGFLRKQTRTWFVHPLACWLTLIVYGDSVITSGVSKKSIMNRNILTQ